MHLNVLLFAECLWGPGDECIFFVNQTGDIIGNSSSRKRCVDASLKNRYISLRLQSANLRCGTHTCCVATYYNEHFFSFFSDLSIGSEYNNFCIPAFI